MTAHLHQMIAMKMENLMLILTGNLILYPPLPCGEAVCVRDADKTDLGDYRFNELGEVEDSGDFRTLSEEGLDIDPEGSTITLSKEDLCKQSNQFDCHVYIDHIKLSAKSLHIETDESRAVVLHLDQPIAYPDDTKITRAIELTNTAELCASEFKQLNMQWQS